MKMLSLELEDILDDGMDKADKANVSTIVGDFKSIDKADVADVCIIVGVKDVTSKFIRSCIMSLTTLIFC
jgi:hypothetical protein